MKFRFAAIAAATLMASTASFAGVVTSSSNVEFLAIDGKKATKSLLKETRSFDVQAQQTHQVVVRVSNIIRSGSDQTLFESNPIVVTFKGTSEDMKVSAPDLSNDRDVDVFKAKPQISVTTVSGQPVEVKQDYLVQEGFLPSLNLVENLSEYNASGATAAVASFATVTMPSAVPTIQQNGKMQKSKVIVQGENAAEQMLQYWYQQADKETQTRFLNWVKTQK